MKYRRPLLIAFGLVLVLAVANGDIIRKQRIVSHGAQILLELRPADPRSLMQGDYMMLRYADAAVPPAAVHEALARRGSVIVALDGGGVARFVRLDDGTALGDGERRLGYRRLSYAQGISYGADAFFFQEGDAEVYGDARYGVLRVDADGNSVLVGLADADRNILTRR
jgi:uncharacterized membrane-anchored protein